MRNTYIKKGEWNTKERRNKITKLQTSEGWRNQIGKGQKNNIFVLQKLI